MRWAYIEPRNPAGYCRYHRRKMSYKYIKRRDCLSRQCRHLLKYDHPVWEMRRRLKEAKMAARAAES